MGAFFITGSVHKPDLVLLLLLLTTSFGDCGVAVIVAMTTSMVDRDGCNSFPVLLLNNVDKLRWLAKPALFETREQDVLI